MYIKIKQSISDTLCSTLGACCMQANREKCIKKRVPEQFIS